MTIARAGGEAPRCEVGELAGCGFGGGGRVERPGDCGAGTAGRPGGPLRHEMVL